MDPSDRLQLDLRSLERRIFIMLDGERIMDSQRVLLLYEKIILQSFTTPEKT